MDITSIGNISKIATYGTTSGTSGSEGSNVEAFNNVLQSVMNMLNETNSLSNEAEKAALDFAMGNSDNTHDLAIAQQKAVTSLQYTVAVRDAVMDAYREIMQLQF